MLWRDRVLRSLVPARAAALLGFEGAVAVLVVYVREVLDRGAGAFGVVLGAGGLGTAIATVLLARRGPGAARTGPLLVAGAGPALLALVALGPGLGALLAVMFVVGAALAGMALYVNTAIAERTPDEARGRAFGLSAAVLEAGDVAGALGVAALADHLAPGNAIAIGGALAAVLALAALAPSVGILRAADGQNRVSPGR